MNYDPNSQNHIPNESNTTPENGNDTPIGAAENVGEHNGNAQKQQGAEAGGGWQYGAQAQSGWQYGTNAQGAGNGAQGAYTQNGPQYGTQEHSGGNWYSGSEQFYQPHAYQNMTVSNHDASTAQVLGIVGLVLAVICCSLPGLILGILAIRRANHARQELGYSLPDAKTGFVCGVIAVVVSSVSMLIQLLYIVIEVILVLSLM
ncbi:MAG: DUF4190 domain-containing protein [Clostridia bacterium]|nr:DUF4190 domain-containing protein [Clostridia bacterium]MBQ9801993.1 DUF4190 domain-containing protein [Clostridia bacterium]